MLPRRLLFRIFAAMLVPACMFACLVLFLQLDERMVGLASVAMVTTIGCAILAALGARDGEPRKASRVTVSILTLLATAAMIIWTCSSERNAITVFAVAGPTVLLMGAGGGVAVLGLHHRRKPDRSLAVAERFAIASLWFPPIASLMAAVLAPDAGWIPNVIMAMGVGLCSFLAMIGIASNATGLRDMPTTDQSAIAPPTRAGRIVAIIGIAATVLALIVSFPVNWMLASVDMYASPPREEEILEAVVFAIAIPAACAGVWSFLGIVRHQGLAIVLRPACTLMVLVTGCALVAVKADELGAGPAELGRIARAVSFVSGGLAILTFAVGCLVMWMNRTRPYAASST